MASVCTSSGRRRNAWPWVLPAMVALTAIVGCGTGLSPEQQAAMSAIRATGGVVSYQGGGYKVELKGRSIDNDDLAQLQAIPKLKSVGLLGTPINDEAIPYLTKITTLEIINIERTGITPEGAETLRKTFPEAEIMY